MPPATTQWCQPTIRSVGSYPRTRRPFRPSPMPEDVSRYLNETATRDLHRALPSVIQEMSAVQAARTAPPVSIRCSSIRLLDRCCRAWRIVISCILPAMECRMPANLSTAASAAARTVCHNSTVSSISRTDQKKGRAIPVALLAQQEAFHAPIATFVPAVYNTILHLQRMTKIIGLHSPLKTPGEVCKLSAYPSRLQGIKQIKARDIL